jgi:transposase
MSYPAVVKARMIRRMTGPEARTAKQLSSETGISVATLCAWLRGARLMAPNPLSDATSTVPALADGEGPAKRRPSDFSPLERARALVEASSLEGEALGAFLRRHGLHAENLQAWSRALEDGPQSDAHKRADKLEGKRIRELEKEILRKDRALAETAALIVLKKKAEMYFGEDEASVTRKKTVR